ncbi:hypothetical protein RJZ57_005647 [Blastomyces gilchristii]
MAGYLVEIDWQSIWAAPLILQARASRLIDYNGGIILHLPENFKQLDQDEKTHVRDQSITSKGKSSTKQGFFTQPFGKSLSELVSFAGNSWDDDIIPLREYLIRLER